jgi:hypothetical protein
MAYREALVMAREADSRSMAPSSVGGRVRGIRLGEYPGGDDQE